MMQCILYNVTNYTASPFLRMRYFQLGSYGMYGVRTLVPLRRGCSSLSGVEVDLSSASASYTSISPSGRPSGGEWSPSFACFGGLLPHWEWLLHRTLGQPPLLPLPQFHVQESTLCLLQTISGPVSFVMVPLLCCLEGLVFALH